RATLAVQLGGRAGELVAIGEASSGAADDLAKATDIATRMVRELGMSARLGPIGYGPTRDLLGPTGTPAREFADATQREIDAEVAHIVRAAEATALDLLREHEQELQKLIDMLLEEETVDGARVYELVGLTPPGEPIERPLSLAPVGPLDGPDAAGTAAPTGCPG